MSHIDAKLEAKQKRRISCENRAADILASREDAARRITMALSSCPGLS